MKYLFATLLIGIAILAHEFGHFIVAKIMRIPIRIFSVGFGPKLIAKKLGSTEYRLSLIPLGGYVLPDVDDEHDFFKIPAGKRIAMSIGGPLASILLPLLCFMFVNVFSLGISFSSVVTTPFVQLYNTFHSMIASLVSISSSEQLSGIIGIINQGGQFVGTDLVRALNFLGLMSLNFAIINMLPIPVLDGGKVLLFCLEKCHVKFLKLHYPLSICGWLLVLGLMLYVSVLDVSRIIA